MKKYGFLAIAVFAIALICLCLPVFAAEETTQNDNQKIREIVNTIDGVGDSRAFAYGDCVLVAVRTKGVYLKSFETELSKLAEEKIREAFPQYTNVKLTTSLKAFRTLERINRALEKGKSLDELDLPFDLKGVLQTRAGARSRQGAAENRKQCVFNLKAFNHEQRQ